MTWTTDISQLPDGTVILDVGNHPVLIAGNHLFSFDFSGWRLIGGRPSREAARVLTPPTSVKALSHGYAPTLHQSVSG
jgi:hypothetical protein